MSGASLVEMAVIMPLPLLMCLGVADFGRVLYWAITLSHAARAGAQYGAQSNATAGDSAGIRQAALQEAQDIGSSNVVVNAWTAGATGECPLKRLSLVE